MLTGNSHNGPSHAAHRDASTPKLPSGHFIHGMEHDYILRQCRRTDNLQHLVVEY